MNTEDIDTIYEVAYKVLKENNNWMPYNLFICTLSNRLTATNITPEIVANWVDECEEVGYITIARTMVRGEWIGLDD